MHACLSVCMCLCVCECEHKCMHQYVQVCVRVSVCACVCLCVCVCTCLFVCECLCVCACIFMPMSLCVYKTSISLSFKVSDRSFPGLARGLICCPRPLSYFPSVAPETAGAPGIFLELYTFPTSPLTSSQGKLLLTGLLLSVSWDESGKFPHEG